MMAAAHKESRRWPDTCAAMLEFVERRRRHEMTDPSHVEDITSFLAGPEYVRQREQAPQEHEAEERLHRSCNRYQLKEANLQRSCGSMPPSQTAMHELLEACAMVASLKGAKESGDEVGELQPVSK